MKKISGSATLGLIFLLFINFNAAFAIIRPSPTKPTEIVPPPFEIKDGERVVFLGNSLFEDDQRYGYLEFALSSRWPERNITFRNLGWSGDTVFGEARSYFTSPPSAYDLMIDQLTKAKPTVVFVAYGANEAGDGEAGVERFQRGLDQLLDKIDALGAKAVLLSPIPLMKNDAAIDFSARNKNLERYTRAIARKAAERNLFFVDLFNPLQQISNDFKISEDGVHLNENGYYHLASIIEEALGFGPRKWAVNIAVSKNGFQTNAPAKILDPKEEDNLRFTVNELFLPFPFPSDGGEMRGNGPTLTITGLDKGYYALTVDGAQVVAASSKKWAEGVEIKQGSSFIQAHHLRELILKKNELFFHQYRPLNRTYIIGFRSYEQGRHKKGLEDLDLLIAWLEGQIESLRQPKAKIYQLTPIK